MRYTTQFSNGEGINLTHHMMMQKMKDIVVPEGWTKHSDFHWSRQLNGKRLDFWPSKDKWIYEGRKYQGGVDLFIKDNI